MKTEETVALEKAIRSSTRKIGVYGCFEVTIGYGGKERVDYMTYEPRTGIFRCYEVKVSKTDFHSDAKKSFVGHYNYFVLTKELYKLVRDEIPQGIGVYVSGECVKKASKRDIEKFPPYRQRRSVGGHSTVVETLHTDMLKESMIRSLYRDSDKLILSMDEQYVGRLKREIDNTRRERDREHYNYIRLCGTLRKELGDEKAFELLEKAGD